MTGQPWYAGAPRVDSWLNALASFGVPTALWLAFDGVLLGMHTTWLGGVLLSIAVAMMLGHVLLVWFKIGWRIAEMSWAALAVVMIAGLWEANYIFAFSLIPIAALFGLIRMRRIVFARYEGRDPAIKGCKAMPPSGPCQICGDKNSEYVAPAICISVVFCTYVYHGKVRNLCLRHARLYALPAVFISMSFGLLGVPWGLILGPVSAAKNIVQGGTRVSGAEAHQMRWKSILEGDAHGYLEAGALFAGLFLVGGLSAVFLGHFDRA